MSRSTDLAGRFGRAAATYDRHAVLQRHAVAGLAARIEAAFRGAAPPARILELGCGTGLLSRALRRLFPDARLVCTDLSPAMLAAARDATGMDRTLFAVADLSRPCFGASFDLVCSSLALQWAPDAAAALSALGELLAPGGQLMLASLAAPSLTGWRGAHRREGVEPGAADLPLLAGPGTVAWEREPVLVPHGGGLSFLRSLRALGADRPRAGHRPLSPGRMRRVLRRFEEEQGATADWIVAYGARRRPARRGVFVTGTDTGVGKTLVSACLVCAWDAEYWKPFQTGLDAEPGDTPTVAALAGAGEHRVHRPLVALGAPLSPAAAAALEGVVVDLAAFRLPPPLADGDPVLVAEGAGGALVPLDDATLLADVLPALALPVVVVARTALGTINHTLLTVEALRRRGIEPLLVLNGPPSPGNRAAIERHSGVRVLAELPSLARITAEAVRRLATLLPSYAELFGEDARALSSAAAAPPGGPARAPGPKG